MTILIVTVHIIVCIALILIVLLQSGKGADMGAAFGGGSSQTLFGSTGGATFLTKATTAAAIVFMLTSLSLAYLSGRTSGHSVMSGQPAREAPAQAAPDAVPQSPAPQGDTQAEPTDQAE